MKNNNSRRTTLIWVFIIFLGLISLCSCCFISMVLFSVALEDIDSSLGKEIIQEGDLEEQIAIIDIKGVISSSPVVDLFGNEETGMASLVIKKLDRALIDDDVKAIILDINTPGGEVYASELIYKKIKEIRDSGKIVIALMEDMAASGGYYVAVSSNKIIASRTTITGSIGVVLTIQDLEGLYEKLGIKTYTITNSNGDFKVMRDGLDDKKSETYRIIQDVSDDAYELFVESVAEGRNMTIEQATFLSDGRIYSGQQAFENGLIDEIGYLPEAIDLATSESNLTDPEIVRYKINDSNSFYGFGLNISKIINSIFPVTQNSETSFKILYQIPL